jgi:ribose 5-phosphate isomerase A
MNLDADQLKRQAALAALAYVTEGSIIGVGTGSTVNHFIDALGDRPGLIGGAVSSSQASSARLSALGIALVDLADIDRLAVYVDGADEINARLEMIKGGGGALTREKIVAAVSTTFVCVADARKKVATLGTFPLPIEVIPMATRSVSSALRAIGGEPRLRNGFVTDNGNVIIDVHGLTITDPRALETQITLLAGVVTCGLFAHRAADVLLLADADGVATILPA